MSEDNVQPLKGFRTPPKPTRGEVEKENVTLGQVLIQKIQSVQQFLGNLIHQTMNQTRDNDRQLQMVSAWLASRTVDDGAQPKDHLLMDYAGLLLQDDGTPATISLTDADGQEQKIPDYFDGGSGKIFMLINLTGGTLTPGFEEQLLGLKANEGREISVQFPKEYAIKSLEGKTAQFTVFVHEVRRPIANSPVAELIDANNAIRVAARNREAEKALAAAKAKAEADAAAKSAEAEALAQVQASAGVSGSTAPEATEAAPTPDAAPAETSAPGSAETAPPAEQAPAAAEESAPATSAEAPAAADPSPASTEAQPTETPAEAVPPAPAEQSAPASSDTVSGAEQTPAST